MDYFLLILLVLLWAFIYTYNGKNILSPSLIATSMFMLSTSLYVMGREYYGYMIHGKTVAVIIASLMALFIGENVSNCNYAPGIQSARLRGYSFENRSSIKVSASWCFVIFAFTVLTGAWCLKDAYEFSLKVGNTTGDYFKVAKFVREANQSGGNITYDKGTILSQMSLLAESLVFFLIYSFCHNLYLCKNKKPLYLLPILGYFLQIFSADNRIGLLKFLAMICVIVFSFMKHSTGWKAGNNKKIIVIGVVVIVIFLALFRWLGYRTDASTRSDANDNFTEYMSASIVGLDVYLTKGEEHNILFGQDTFNNIYNILRQWGFDIPKTETFEEFFNYAQGVSNIYTGIKVFINDFTLIGGLIAIAIYGYVVASQINKIKCGRIGFTHMWLTGHLFYPIVMFSIANVMRAILAIPTLYMLLYTMVINWFFTGKKKV